MTGVRRLARAVIDGGFVARPLLLVPVWGFSVLGYVRGCEATGGGPWPIVDIRAFFWMAVFSLSVAAVYVLNQLTDIEADRANAGFPLIARGAVGRAVSWASLASASILSLLAPLLGERLPVAVFSAAALALGCLYCLRPARLCGRPGFDFLTNAFGFGFVAFGVGWYLSGASLQIRILAAEALPYFLLMCGGSISSTVCDIDGDREARKLTTAVVLGPAPAHSLALLFVAAGAALGVARGDLSSAAAGLLSSAIYVACSMLRRQSVCEATYKVGGGILMVMAAAHAPVFAAVSCGVLIATRMYFRLRHHVTYPSLVPSRT